MDDRRILLELEDEVQFKSWNSAPGRRKEKSPIFVPSSIESRPVELQGGAIDAVKCETSEQHCDHYDCIRRRVRFRAGATRSFAKQRSLSLPRRGASLNFT
jgi:hypothetical protein